MTGALIVTGIIAFSAGLWAGFLVRALLARRISYSGSIFITKTQEKTIFSLELDDEPEVLAFKDEVLFKIHTFEESLDRT